MLRQQWKVRLAGTLTLLELTVVSWAPLATLATSLLKEFLLGLQKVIRCVVKTLHTMELQW